MTSEEMEKVQEEHVAAENRRDVDAAVVPYRDDCYYENVPMSLRFDGKQGVVLQYAALFHTFPD